MKLSQLPFTEERTLRLKPIASVAIEEGSGVRLSVTGPQVQIRTNNQVGVCEFIDSTDGEWLKAPTASNTYVAELLRADSQQVVVRVLVFDALERWPGGRVIGVDDATVVDVNRYRRRERRIGEVVQWLSEQLTVDDADIAIVSAGGIEQGAFSLVGQSIIADVQLIDERLIITRISGRQTRRGGRHLTLVHGVVSIDDATRLGRIGALEREEIRRLQTANNAYLAIWKEYNELERAAAKEAARDIGAAAYDRFHVRPDGSLEFDLVLSHRSEQLLQRIGHEKVGLEASDGIAFEDDSAKTSLVGIAEATPMGTVLLRPDRPYDPAARPLPSRGDLAGAYTMDRVRISRREKAQEVLGRSETMPAVQMSLILADERLSPVGRVRRFNPLSPKVRKILGGSPTPAQIQAIDIAINSHDLALIQGPPGTGKTRVIAAIQARLGEINKDLSALDRRVLLTSYQHDAVENLVQAADDTGYLPPVKLGRAEGVDDESFLTAWTHGLQSRLRNRYDSVPPNDLVRARRALRDRADAYLNRGDRAETHSYDISSTVDLMNWLAEHVDLVSSDIAFEARKLAKRLSQSLGSALSTTATQTRVIRIVRALRVTADGFADDGRITASRAYKTQGVFDRLDDAERETLKDVAVGCLGEEESARFLARLKPALIDRLRDTHVRALLPATTLPEVEALLHRAEQEGDKAITLRTSPIEHAVEQFRDAVDHQPDAIRRSLRTHTRALAATCQQSVSGDVREVQRDRFDTVVIDEAARANPLDLMIPISLAKERVILVGDHRQLPQLLDDELVPQLSERHDSESVDAILSRSMFERLFTKLRDAERTDGTKRVVTLDRQFRMHPVLGTFISEQFYAPFGEQLSNGNPDESAYAHTLDAYAGAVCGWIDVPADVHGPSHRTGTSVSRLPEAEVIVAELQAGLQASPSLTFGVITFYSGQVTEIWSELERKGLATRHGYDFELHSSVRWLFNEDGLPRVRIGTVDAFQGREFDVVYLSTTRTKSTGSARSNPFGFLVLPNRLCVAMSRQRRLLVAVGDAATFTTTEARLAVPSLAAFHDLAGGEYGFRRSI